MSAVSLSDAYRKYYGIPKNVIGPGLPLTVDELNFFSDATIITADATVTP